MQNSFQVEVLRFEVLRELPGALQTSDFRALLDATEFDDEGANDSDLRELCLMSLQDCEPEEAARLALSHFVEGRMTPGQIRNSAEKMRDEKLWEEFADFKLHERIFAAASLLYEAFPAAFPEPDAVRVTLGVVANNASARACLKAPLPESWVVRLLADGMDDRSILHRLFDEQLASSTFLEADSIVWIVDSEPQPPDALTLRVISAGGWLDPLRDTKSYESSARPDARSE